MSDSAGQIVWSAVHWPFGKPFEVVKTKGLRLRFPGQWAIGGTGGLSYNWHCFYDPKTGRYTRPDPLGFIDRPNVYAYVNSNPLGFVDPDGLDVTVSFSPNAAGGYGHVGINVNSSDTVGQRPQSDASPIRMGLGMNVPGEISADPRAPFSITIPTTRAQDRNAQQCINTRIQQQQDYNLFSNNCTLFVQQCLRAAGRNTPNTIFPRKLFNGLEQRFGGGP